MPRAKVCQKPVVQSTRVLRSHTRKRRRIGLLDLPNEVLDRIFQRCGNLAVRATCTRFWEMVDLTLKQRVMSSLARSYAILLTGCCLNVDVGIQMAPQWLRLSEAGAFCDLVTRNAREVYIPNLERLERVTSKFSLNLKYGTHVLRTRLVGMRARSAAEREIVAASKHECLPGLTLPRHIEKWIIEARHDDYLLTLALATPHRLGWRDLKFEMERIISTITDEGLEAHLARK